MREQNTGEYFKLLEALEQAAIATDPAGNITYWSPAAEALYGWGAAEVIGRDVLEITPDHLSRDEGATIMQVLARGEVWSGQFRVHTREQLAFEASVTTVPLIGEGDKVVGVVGVSARANSRTDVLTLVRDFARACDTVWPGKVVTDIDRSASLVVGTPGPHLIQLLSLLVLLYDDALTGTGKVEIVVGSADHSPFADFGLASVGSATYVKVGSLDPRPSRSVFRSLSRTAQPTRYVSALVRIMGGMLISSNDPDRKGPMHLFLPVVDVQLK